jgi:hypothetical protein
VSDVETPGVSAKQPFHPEDQIGHRGFDDQMKMIAHQAIGMNLPFRFSTSLAERREEPFTVSVILENVLAPITAVDNMLNGSRVLDAQFARRRQHLSAQPLWIDSED